jgi:tetratricopeptide (TPR) repeat protein
MHTRWSGAALIALVVMIAGAAAAAEGKGSGNARRLYDEATAAFGLGRYADAAEKYEAAFAARPDPALLYNAAQAYRLAGNKTRALELYRNYVRLYSDRPNTADARNHIAALQRALEAERAAPDATAGTTAAAAPPPLEPAAPASSPPAAIPPATEPAPALVASTPANEPERTPITRRPWFWIAVGAALVGGTVAVLLATRGTTYPDASFGKAQGN